MEDCDQKNWSFCQGFGINDYTLSSYIPSGSRSTRFIKSNHQSFFKGKKTVKIVIFRLLFEGKTEECNQEDWTASEKFGII